MLLRPSTWPSTWLCGSNQPAADRANQLAGLGQAINGERSLDNLAAAMVAIGLCGHGEICVERVLAKFGERIDQVESFSDAGLQLVSLRAPSLERRAGMTAASLHLTER